MALCTRCKLIEAGPEWKMCAACRMETREYAREWQRTHPSKSKIRLGQILKDEGIEEETRRRILRAYFHTPSRRKAEAPELVESLKPPANPIRENGKRLTLAEMLAGKK